MDPWLADDLRAVKDKTAQPLFEVAVRYATTTSNSTGTGTGTGRRSEGSSLARVRGLADGVASAFGAFTGRNRLARRRVHFRPAADVLARRRLRHGFLLSVTELAALAHLPYDTALAGLEAARRPAESRHYPASPPPGKCWETPTPATLARSRSPWPTPAPTCTSSAKPDQGSPPC